MKDIRRKIALLICPELAPERSSHFFVDRKRFMETSGHVVTSDFQERLLFGDRIRELLGLYEAYSGDMITEKYVLDHFGVVRKRGDYFSNLPKIIRSYAHAAHHCGRLRRNPLSGCKKETYVSCIELMNAIWPPLLQWPRSIPRPDTSNKEDAA